MTGFTSQDDIVNSLSVNGTGYRTDWQKSTFATTAHTAGLWYSLMRGGGNPAADTILGTGTNLAFQALTDATATASGIPHGGNVTDYKVLLNAAAQTAAATVAPCVLMLVDVLGFYPITTTTTTGAQTLNNTVTLPRYTNGAGVQAFLTPSTVMGAATPNLSINYTNSASVAGAYQLRIDAGLRPTNLIEHTFSGTTGAGESLSATTMLNTTTGASHNALWTSPAEIILSLRVAQDATFTGEIIALAKNVTLKPLA